MLLIPANPPRTFMEAVQFFYFIHLVRYSEYSTLGIQGSAWTTF